jgi:hypothetical protein
MKRLRNSSGIPNETVNAIVVWIAGRLSISQFDVECRSSRSTFAGRAYTTGARSYHGNRRPFVVLRIGTETTERWVQRVKTERFPRGMEFHYARRSHAQNPALAQKIVTRRFPTFVQPYQYAHHKSKRYVLANRTEALVYLAAHELRHLWQAARLTDKRKSAPLPMGHGSKGKFSEVDTESFAIHMLREWRRGVYTGM